MPVQTFIMDPRLPISQDTSKDDPNHPTNVCKGMQILQNQASADTKYDIHPPPRIPPSQKKEPFENPPSKDDTKFLVSLLLVAASLTLAILARSMFLKIVSIAILFVCIQYAVHKLENRTV